MIKAITFDLWWTIFDYSESITERRFLLLSERLNACGFDPQIESLKEAYVHTQDFFENSWERAKRSFSSRERLESIIGRIGVSLPPKDLTELLTEIEEAALDEPPDLTCGVEEALRSLYGTYRLAIISDTGMTSGRVLRILLERAGLLRLFSLTLFSDEVGYYKPHPEIFREALRSLRVDPQESVHVGDNPETDIKGAKGMGMKAILFNPPGSMVTDAGQADAIIASYEGLKEAVESL